MYSKEFIEDYKKMNEVRLEFLTFLKEKAGTIPLVQEIDDLVIGDQGIVASTINFFVLNAQNFSCELDRVKNEIDKQVEIIKTKKFECALVWKAKISERSEYDKDLSGPVLSIFIRRQSLYPVEKCEYCKERYDKAKTLSDGPIYNYSSRNF